MESAKLNENEGTLSHGVPISEQLPVPAELAASVGRHRLPITGCSSLPDNLRAATLTARLATLIVGLNC